MHVRVIKRMTSWQGIFFGLFVTILGVGLGIFAIDSITTYNEKDSTFVETVAEVIGYDYNDDGLKAIIAEYKIDGNTYTKTSNSYSISPKSIGTEVGIKYDPTNPSDAIWVFDSTNVVVPIFAGVFTIIGVYIMIVAAKKVKNDEEYM